MYSYLSDSQKRAVDAINNGKNVFITGPAGTGKSYLLQYIKKEFGNKNIHITAMTGIAAVNVSGTTLHSWANLGLETLPLSEMVKNIFSAKGINIRKKLQSAEILAIDEISMLSESTFELLNELLKSVRQNKLPFGGIQLIMFGDFFQLPPVKNTMFCFESPVWQEAEIEVIELKTCFRQQDEVFVKLLNNIRYGLKLKEDIKLLKERYYAVDESSIKPTILTTHNVYAEKTNLIKLNEIASIQREFSAEFKGDKLKIEFLKKNCIAQEELLLKIGSQVMMLKNTYQKEGVINGSIGIVVGFSIKKHYPIVQFENGIEKMITPEIWEIRSFNQNTHELTTDATMTQIPLRLAWAITIHKSQGMTLDKIDCDLKDVFTEGQTYVALSRARNLKGIFIKSFDVNNIKANKKVIDFYKSYENIE